MGLRDAWARQQARADAAKEEKTAEKARVTAQHVKVETWMADHEGWLVATFANLRVYPDQLIVLHPLVPLTKPEEHEIHPLAGLCARVERDGGGTYARGTLTRTAIGAGHWQKKETQQVTQTIVIEGPSTHISARVGQFTVTKHERFVRDFNAAAARVTTTQPVHAPEGDDIVVKLRHIGELHEAGIIDDTEFAALKARFIDG